MSDKPFETPAAHVEFVGEGPPLLLLHGWGTSSELWAPILPGLQADHRLIIPDLPGFGRTAPPSVAWSAHEYADWLTALLDRLEVPRVDVVGHSNGGRVALVLAAEHPERVGKVVVTGGAGIRPRHGVRYHMRVRTFKMMRALSTSAAVPAVLRQSLAARVAKRGSEDYRASSGAMRGTLVRLVNEDLTPLLHRIAAPVLLIWGERDAETPLEDGRAMERALHDAGLVVFEGAGHYAYLEQPQRFCRIVDTFLRQQVS